MPCLWVDKLIFVISHSLHSRFAGVTLSALFPHSFGSISKVCPHWQPCLDIGLPHCSSSECLSKFHNCYKQCPISCKPLFCLAMIYYTLYGIWNYVASLVNGSSPSTTFFFSFCYMATWFNYLCKLWVTTQFMFVAILLLFLGIFFCHIFKSLQQLFA